MTRHSTHTRGPIGIIACDSGKPFAQKIVKSLTEIVKREAEKGLLYEEPFALVATKEHTFPNTEIKTVIDESIRGNDVYIIQDCENKVGRQSIDRQLRALTTAIDAARRADAHYITAVLPYFPYSRQDRAQGREPITAALVAREIEVAGAHHIITLDVHNEAIGGFFRTVRSFENLHASKALIPYIQKTLGADNLVVVSPDAGGARRAEYYAKYLRTPLAIMYKSRDYSRGEVERMMLLGDVKGKNVVLIDDMIATAGTLKKAVELLKESGATNISFACCLPLFTPPALDNIQNAVDAGLLNRVIGTDAVYHGGDVFIREHPWYWEVSVAPYFAEVIYNMNHNKSISSLLTFSELP